MRNFEERKAEVFRRSESRIKERKRNRSRILALCVPLCLILSVWLVAIQLPMRPGGHPDVGNQHMGNILGGTTGAEGEDRPGLAHSFVLVEVNGTGAHEQHHATISDAPGVNDVFEQIYTILIPHESYDELVGGVSDGVIGLPDEDGSDQLQDYANDIKSSGYIITMQTANGVNRTFTLTDSKLYDAELHLEIELTDEQISALKSVLGLKN